LLRFRGLGRFPPPGPFSYDELPLLLFSPA
jgi:hypothetical protein